MKEEGEIGEVLSKYRTVAVVGLSKDASKDSHQVAEYLKNKGYRIIPINPNAEEILGEKSYPSLASLPENIAKQVEIVDIFRPSEAVPPVVEEAIHLRTKYGKPCVIWMQLGISNEAAAQSAREAGMTVIQNRCMMIERRDREKMTDFRL
ncbi:MAG: CoA-binding protein [Methanomassiliicoccales archaeon]